MQGRLQRTIRQSVETSGIGFLTGRDIRIRFHPAAVNQGIEFRRTDCPGSPPIPARIEFAVHRQRRTAIERDGTAVEMIEHVMAALAGLWIDNCLVEIDGPEPPGLDGSSLQFAELLLGAESSSSRRARPTIAVPETVFVAEPEDESEITYRPPARPGLTIGYHLDYGPRSPIPTQKYSIEVTPESFMRELAFARTFVLETEVAALRAAGYGVADQRRRPVGLRGGRAHRQRAAGRRRVRPPQNPRLPRETSRCLGCDIEGQFSAYRSGHHLNRTMVRKLAARALERDARTFQSRGLTNHISSGREEA